MKIAVYCESGRDTGLELIGRARDMAPEAHISALVETPDDLDRLKGLADEAVCLGLTDDDCAQGTKTARALKASAPDIALFPATVRGRFLSAWAAAKLDTGLTADCTGLDITFDGLLRQTRPAYGSNLTAQILCREKRPQMASVRPKVFPMPRDEDRSARPMVITDPGEIPADDMLTLLRYIPVEGGASLQNADVVVAGGKGIGGREGFALLEKLASLLGGAVGATRSAVDAGWAPYARQIGQTGVTVRPLMYIAFGISGMIQHTVGMSASKTVIAVNTDRNAPIFRSADIGIVAPWRETAEYMIEYLSERKCGK